MQENNIRFRKKREVGEVINDSIAFLKQEHKPVSRILLVYVLPFVILYAAAQVYFQRNVMVNFDFTDPESMMGNIGPFYLNLFFFMLFSLFIQSLLAGTYYSYIEAYIKKGKGNFELSDITSHFFSNSLLALGAGFVYTVIVLMGVMLCILPGIFMANSLSLVVFIFIFEKRGINDSLMSSLRLVNSQWWNTLLINLIGLVLVYVAGIILSIPGMFAGGGGNLMAPAPEAPVEYPQWYWVLNGISSAVTTLLLIIPYTFQAFQYFNLKERLEPGSGQGTGIQL